MRNLEIKAKKVKYRLRQFAVRGRFLWLWSIFKYIENLWKYHSLKRFRNLWSFFFFTRIRGYKILRIDSQINRGVFYMCLSSEKEGRFIHKIPRFDNQYSENLRKELKEQKAQQEYSELLMNLNKTPHLGRHFPLVSRVRKDGGYSSAFISGYNLAVLRDLLRKNQKMPEEVQERKLIKAIDELMKNIKEYYNVKGVITGDWPPHNLVYDPVNNIIYNVDLEGIYLYDPTRVESNIQYITSELKSIKTTLFLQADKKNDEILHTLAVISHAIDPHISYSGRGFFTGYHSLRLKDHFFHGQRDCAARLKDVPFDFSNKTVLDMGCNTGGMLHALAGKIKTGIGIDWDSRAINAANAIRHLNNINNTHFYIFDLEKEDLDFITNFILDEKIDICFLLSILMWVNNGRQLVKFASETAPYLLFETNGSPLQQKEQFELVKERYKTIDMITSESEDDPSQKKRKLYLCRRSD